MPNNRVLAAAAGVLTVAWFMLGGAVGFFVGLPAWLIWTDFVTYLLVLIFTPAVMSKAGWTAPGAVTAGVIRMIRGIVGLISLPTSELFGPAVGFVLGLLFTYFSFRAYQEK